MVSKTDDIKTMKLYRNIDRIHRELKQLGKEQQSTLCVENLSPFDQLHYHGTDAVDMAINQLKINANHKVLEIGSGIGGPARYIANQTQAQVYALELQADQNQLAEELTYRCELSELVHHLCGDILLYDWKDLKFDRIVSWLALYHIEDRDTTLKRCREALIEKGEIYIEDLYGLSRLSNADRDELEQKLFANYLPSSKKYQMDLMEAGFIIKSSVDMTQDWKEFTHTRLLTYRENRQRHVAVHGEETVDGLEEFYTTVDHYFASGKLGGLRIHASL